MSKFASVSTAEAVPPPIVPASTFAPAVVLLTQPRTAPPSDLLKIVTPYRWQAWESLLREAGVLDQFADIPNAFRFGWRLGVPDSYSLESSFLPPNHRSAFDHSDFILDYVESELAVGRYSGPFSPSDLEALIGPFRTSPLGVIPKPGSSKFRLIQDHSFPRGDPVIPSVNSLIDTSGLEVDWGTFSDCWLLVARSPPGSQVAVFDVEAAHRRSPLAPEDQHLVCVKIDFAQATKIFLDHCASFGGASSSFLFERPANGIACIYRFKGVDDLAHWSDDFIFFRYPSAYLPDGSYSFSYDESLLYSVADTLGWPWSPSKCLPFNTSFPYLGFSWDLSNKSVCIPDKKKAKYLDRISSWVPGASVSLKECQSVVGCLQHCTLVLSEGRSRLPSLFRLASSFRDPSKPFVRHRISQPALADISWWRDRLSAAWCGCSISIPSDPLPISTFVDASTSFGIGFLSDKRWLAWRLLDGWKSDGRDIGWAEMVAIDLGLRTLIHSGFSDCHLVFFSDNRGVVDALSAGRSRNPRQNEVLRHIVSNFRDHNIWLSVEWVESAANLADSISRGLFPSSLSRHPRPPPLPVYLKNFVAFA